MSTAATVDPVVIAQKVVAFNATDGNPFDILNLAPNVPPVDLTSSVDVCRGNYRRMAGLIHPDRIRTKYEHATEAFQKLVRVFEMISDPTVRRQLERRFGGSKKASKQQTSTTAKKSSSSSTTTANKAIAGTKAKAIKDKKKSSTSLVVTAATSTSAKPKKATPKRKKKANEDSSEEEDASHDSFIVHDGSSEDTDYEEEEVSDDEGREIDYIDTYEDDLGLRPSKARDNTGCFRTKIGCPNCRERWQPDDDRAYVLFMKYGVKMHCATCLIQFGPATALHFCPLCKKASGTSEDGGYDVSQYDRKTKCRCCSGSYGYHSCLITEAALEGARDRIRTEEAARKRSEERMMRALSRGVQVAEVEVMSAAKTPTSGNVSGGGGTGLASAEGKGQLDMIVGQVLVTGTCSICHKSVPAKSAQSHVEKCFVAPPKATKKAAAAQKKDSSEKKTPSATKKDSSAAKKSAAPKAKKSASLGKKRTRGRSNDSRSASDSFSSDSSWVE